MNTTDLNIARHLADELGVLSADLAVLRDRERDIKARLVALVGDGAVEGDLYRVTVSPTSTRRIDWRKVAEHFSPSRQLLQAWTTTTDSVRVAVKARLTDKRAA